MYLKQSVYFITLLSIFFQVNTLFYQLFKIPDRSDTNFWTNLTSIRGQSTNVGRDCSVDTIQDFLWELGRKPLNASRGNHHFFIISFFRIENQNFAIFEEALKIFVVLTMTWCSEKIMIYNYVFHAQLAEKVVNGIYCSLTRRMVSATTMIGLRSTWARAKTWISSRLSYIIDDAPLELELDPVEAVELAEDEPDSPCESKSLDGNATILNLDRRRCAAAGKTSELRKKGELVIASRI